MEQLEWLFEVWSQTVKQVHLIFDLLLDIQISSSFRNTMQGKVRSVGILDNTSRLNMSPNVRWKRIDDNVCCAVTLYNVTLKCCVIIAEGVKMSNKVALWLLPYNSTFVYPESWTYLLLHGARNQTSLGYFIRAIKIN